MSLSSWEWVKRRSCRWGSHLHTYLPCPLNDCCDWCEYDIVQKTPNQTNIGYRGSWWNNYSFCHYTNIINLVFWRQRYQTPILFLVCCIFLPAGQSDSFTTISSPGPSQSHNSPQGCALMSDMSFGEWSHRLLIPEALEIVFLTSPWCQPVLWSFATSSKERVGHAQLSDPWARHVPALLAN